MSGFKVILPIKGKKQYAFPISWLTNYVLDNTEYDSMIKFTQKCTINEADKAAKAAFKEGKGSYI